jgi:hypothetical protein
VVSGTFRQRFEEGLSVPRGDCCVLTPLEEQDRRAHRRSQRLFPCRMTGVTLHGVILHSSKQVGQLGGARWGAA